MLHNFDPSILYSRLFSHLAIVGWLFCLYLQAACFMRLSPYSPALLSTLFHPKSVQKSFFQKLEKKCCSPQSPTTLRGPPFHLIDFGQMNWLEIGRPNCRPIAHRRSCQHFFIQNQSKNLFFKNLKKSVDKWVFRVIIAFVSHMRMWRNRQTR